MNKKIEEGICPICDGKVSFNSKSVVVCENGCNLDFITLENKKEQILELHGLKEEKRKYSYQRIGEIVGVTKQYVGQIVKGYLTNVKE